MYMPRVLFLNSKSVSEEALSRADLPVEKIFADRAEEVIDLVSSEQVDLCVFEASDTGVRRLCDDLRKTPKGAVMPILLIGGEGTVLENIEEAVQWGADAVVDRGAPDADLADRIATILGLDALDPKTYSHRPATMDRDPDDPPEVSDEEPAEQESDERQTEAGEDGRLELEPLWSVLASLRSRRATGVLTLMSRDVERKIFMEEGDPTMATSSAREDRLIELLHREGRLNERQYEQAAMTIGASGRRAGVVLVEKGLIASRELFPLVRHHYETIIFDSFAWSVGSWRFAQGKHRSSERVLLDLPTASIIVEGLRSRAPLSEIQKIVARDARPKNTGGGICPLEETGLSDRELEPLEWLDGTRGVDEIAERFSVVVDDLYALIAGLAVLGWVHVTGGDNERSAKDAQGGESLWTDVDRRQESRIEMARVVDKQAQVAQGNYFAIMQVPPEASGHEIRKAYRRLRGLFAVERFVTPELLDLQPKVEEIRLVLDEAYEILRNASLREAYRATMDVE